MDTVEARALAAQPCAGRSSPALLLPRRHRKEPNQVGQPVPTYSTVLPEVRPQVERVSVPPRGVESPRLRR